MVGAGPPPGVRPRVPPGLASENRPLSRPNLRPKAAEQEMRIDSTRRKPGRRLAEGRPASGCSARAFRRRIDPLAFESPTEGSRAGDPDRFDPTEAGTPPGGGPAGGGPAGGGPAGGRGPAAAPWSEIRQPDVRISDGRQPSRRCGSIRSDGSRKPQRRPESSRAGDSDSIRWNPMHAFGHPLVRAHSATSNRGDRRTPPARTAAFTAGGLPGAGHPSGDGCTAPRPFPRSAARVGRSTHSLTPRRAPPPVARGTPPGTPPA